MSRFQNFLRQFSWGVAPETFSHPLAIDLGSLHTRVAVQGKLIAIEPTCVARHRVSQEVVAIGESALKLLGKTPPDIEVVFPVRRGKVHSRDAVKDLLSALMERAPVLKVLPVFLSRAINVGVPSAVSVIEEDALKKVCQVISNKVQTIKKTQAVWESLFLQGKNFRQLCIIDIGAMTTEMAVFSEGQVVVSRTVEIGGEDFTQAVISAVRRTHHCEIGWETAERIKKEIGRVPTSESRAEKRAAIRGRNILSSLPVTQVVESGSFYDGFAKLSEDIFNEFRAMSQECSPELISDALEQGIFLTGGASLLSGMGESLSTKLQSPILYSQSPFEDIVRGL